MVRSGKSKRKPFNSNVADYLLVTATFAFNYPLVLSDTSNICKCGFYRCRTRSANQGLCDFLSAGFFALLDTLVDRYSLRSKAETSFFLSQPSVAALTLSCLVASFV